MPPVHARRHSRLLQPLEEHLPADLPAAALPKRREGLLLGGVCKALRGMPGKFPPDLADWHDTIPAEIGDALVEALLEERGHDAFEFPGGAVIVVGLERGVVVLLLL